jgi:hypothetical protein
VAGKPALPIFPHVKDSQNEDVLIRYFVANLVVAHQYSPNFTGLELNQPGT